MSTEALKKQLKTKAVKDVKGAIEELLSQVESSSSIHHDALNLLGQYHLLQREQIKQTTSAEQAGLRFRQLLDGFLQLVDLLSAEHLASSIKSTTTYYIDQQHTPIPLDLEALEQEGLRRQAELIIRKLNRLKEALILATDVSVQFKYEHEIGQLEEQLRGLKG